MKNMTYDALDVACYIINYCNYNDMEITNLRLQKLLYFVQAASFSERKQEFFHNDIEAWTYGPTIREVYKEYSRYMGNHIYPTTIYKVFRKGVIGVDYVVYNESVFKKKDKVLIMAVIEVLKDKTTYELVEISRRQSPWVNAYEKGVYTVLTNEDMSERFCKGERVCENYTTH